MPCMNENGLFVCRFQGDRMCVWCGFVSFCANIVYMLCLKHRQPVVLEVLLLHTSDTCCACGHLCVECYADWKLMVECKVESVPSMDTEIALPARC